MPSNRDVDVEVVVQWVKKMWWCKSSGIKIYDVEGSMCSNSTAKDDGKGRERMGGDQEPFCVRHHDSLGTRGFQ